MNGVIVVISWPFFGVIDMLLSAVMAQHVWTANPGQMMMKIPKNLNLDRNDYKIGLSTSVPPFNVRK